MARISGVDLPREKRLEIGLTYIFGIGRTRAREASIGARVKVRFSRGAGLDAVAPLRVAGTGDKDTELVSTFPP